MLRAKFQNHRTWFLRRGFLKVLDGHHLGHVTCIIDINFLSRFLRKLHIKFGLDWPCGFREDAGK